MEWCSAANFSKILFLKKLNNCTYHWNQLRQLLIDTIDIFLANFVNTRSPILLDQLFYFKIADLALVIFCFLVLDRRCCPITNLSATVWASNFKFGTELGFEE